MFFSLVFFSQSSQCFSRVLVLLPSYSAFLFLNPYQNFVGNCRGLKKGEAFRVKIVIKRDNLPTNCTYIILLHRVNHFLHT